jgi:hypothetical protein
MIDDLYKGKCLVTLRYSDGSEIQCISTLKEEILQNLSLDYVDGLVDLLTMKIIPNDIMLEVDSVTVELNKNILLSPLDETFIDAIKGRWEDA